MSTIKHTPGPWVQVPQTNGGTLIAHPFETGKQMSPRGLRVICFTMDRASSLFEDEANARLIAAAPGLLEALEYALPYFEACVPNPRNGVNADYSVDVNCVIRARAAIAKATGSAS
jgi:hypothetical protein